MFLPSIGWIKTTWCWRLFDRAGSFMQEWSKNFQREGPIPTTNPMCIHVYNLQMLLRKFSPERIFYYGFNWSKKHNWIFHEGWCLFGRAGSFIQQWSKNFQRKAWISPKHHVHTILQPPTELWNIQIWQKLGDSISTLSIRQLRNRLVLW